MYTLLWALSVAPVRTPEYSPKYLILVWIKIEIFGPNSSWINFVISSFRKMLLSYPTSENLDKIAPPASLAWAELE